MARADSRAAAMLLSGGAQRRASCAGTGAVRAGGRRETHVVTLCSRNALASAHKRYSCNGSRL